MKTHIAILAACASTMVLTAIPARAGGPIPEIEVGVEYGANVQGGAAIAGENVARPGEQIDRCAFTGGVFVSAGDLNEDGVRVAVADCNSDGVPDIAPGSGHATGNPIVHVK